MANASSYFWWIPVFVFQVFVDHCFTGCFSSLRPILYHYLFLSLLSFFDHSGNRWVSFFPVQHKISFAAFWACTELLDRFPLKTRSSLNKRWQATDAWRLLKVRLPATEPAACERAATYSHVRKNLFPIVFKQTLRFTASVMYLLFY